MPKFLGSRFN
jgi:hypothetical protein